MNVVYSILFGLGAYFLYRFHKFWLTKRENDLKNVTKIQSIQNWLLILFLILASIFCLFI